jgi:hypothetical protein
MNPEPKAEQPRGGDPMAAKTAQHNTTNSVSAESGTEGSGGGPNSW